MSLVFVAQILVVGVFSITGAVLQVPLNASTSQFAAKLYHEISGKTPRENLLISPVSIQLILGLLQTGAVTPTRDELSQVLVLPVDETELEEHLVKLRHSFTRVNDAASREANVTIANAIYVRPDVRVGEKFYETAKKTLNIDVRSLGSKLRNGTTVAEEINEWIKRETSGQIERVMDETSITPDTIMLLLNTLYFQGKWRDNGFNKSETRPERFYSNPISFHEIPMMHTSDYFLIGRYKSLNVTYLELPYSGRHIDDTGDYVLAVYLPDIYENGGELIRDNIEHLLMHPPDITNVEQVDVRIPRFKIRAKNHLKPVLESLGLKHVFTNARLPDLTVDKRSVQVTDVVHNTALDVTEDGTEASAVTVIGIDDRIFSQPIPFVANRPFLFTLKQKSTHVVLFVGHFQNGKQHF